LHYSDALEACKPVLRLLLRRFEGQHSFHNFTVELEQGSDKAKGTIFSFKCVPSQVCRPVDSKPSAIADRSFVRSRRLVAAFALSVAL
jgi:tRNA U38,U39,U40 pseudouridine synthase TruA